MAVLIRNVLCSKDCQNLLDLSFSKSLVSSIHQWLSQYCLFKVRNKNAEIEFPRWAMCLSHSLCVWAMHKLIQCTLTSQDFLRTIMNFQLNSIHWDIYLTHVPLSSLLLWFFIFLGVGNISKSRYSFLKSNTFFKDIAIIKIVIQMACSYKVYFNWDIIIYYLII